MRLNSHETVDEEEQEDQHYKKSSTPFANAGCGAARRQYDRHATTRNLTAKLADLMKYQDSTIWHSVQDERSQ
jgi:hypothetical protein